MQYPIGFIYTLIFSFLINIGCVHAQHGSHSQGSQIDMVELENQLNTEGISGWIHGRSADQKLYVFVYRSPNSFFDDAHFPLLSATPEVTKLLPTLSRHDKVKIKGTFVKNKAPITHIRVQSIEVIKDYSGAHEYEYGFDLEEALEGQNELIGKVHIVAEGGKVLVLEWKDRVIPVFVNRPDLTRELFRNDKIRIKIEIQKKPLRPIHLNVAEVENAVEVLEPMRSYHNVPVQIEGHLVMYPQSPQIIFDVFAVEQVLGDDVTRDFTLVNFDNPEVFKAIRDKLSQVWAANLQSSEKDRNKLINRSIKIRAKGTGNVIDPAQANPQILLKSADDIEIL